MDLATPDARHKAMKKDILKEAIRATEKLGTAYFRYHRGDRKCSGLLCGDDLISSLLQIGKQLTLWLETL
ncbi:MAG: hypothetical protein JRJ41_07615 [Deltaproteobacteria bacterium]|nr:hypothetical protein [Deltaproteobacteria bacterium]